MKFLQLTKGKVALIDDEDWDKCNSYLWRLHSKGYANTSIDGRHVYLHRFILSEPVGQVDHKNNNRLDCRKQNLRVTDSTGNNRNRSVTRLYKGVCWNQNAQRFQAAISVDRKQIYLGLFDDPIEAAKTYDKAAKQHFGEYAKLNCP